MSTFWRRFTETGDPNPPGSRCSGRRTPGPFGPVDPASPIATSSLATSWRAHVSPRLAVQFLGTVLLSLGCSARSRRPPVEEVHGESVAARGPGMRERSSPPRVDSHDSSFRLPTNPTPVNALDTAPAPPAPAPPPPAPRPLNPSDYISIEIGQVVQHTIEGDPPACLGGAPVALPALPLHAGVGRNGDRRAHLCSRHTATRAGRSAAGRRRQYRGAWAEGTATDDNAADDCGLGWAGVSGHPLVHVSRTVI